MTVKIDASDFATLARALNGLPGEIKVKAISRALRRVGEMARTQIVRKAAADSGMRVGDVRSKTLLFNAGGGTASIIMRSEWWPLFKLGGARQTKTGVTVRNWGSHAGAFIGGLKSGHQGVFRRVGAGRLPIRELWGPNPVAEICQDEPAYAALLAEVAETRLAPHILHEVDRLLDRMG